MSNECSRVTKLRKLEVSFSSLSKTSAWLYRPELIAHVLSFLEASVRDYDSPVGVSRAWSRATNKITAVSYYGGNTRDVKRSSSPAALMHPFCLALNKYPNATRLLRFPNSYTGSQEMSFGLDVHINWSQVAQIEVRCLPESGWTTFFLETLYKKLVDDVNTRKNNSKESKQRTVLRLVCEVKGDQIKSWKVMSVASSVGMLMNRVSSCGNPANRAILVQVEDIKADICTTCDYSGKHMFPIPCAICSKTSNTCCGDRMYICRDSCERIICGGCLARKQCICHDIVCKECCPPEKVEADKRVCAKCEDTICTRCICYYNDEELCLNCKRDAEDYSEQEDKSADDDDE